MSSTRLPLFQRLTMIRRLYPLQYTSDNGVNYIAKCTIRSFISGGTEDEYKNRDKIYEALSLLCLTISSFSSSSSLLSYYDRPPCDILSLVFRYMDCETMIRSIYQVNRYWQALVDTPSSWVKLHFSGDYSDLLFTYTILPRVLPSLRDVSFYIVPKSLTADYISTPAIKFRERSILINVLTRVSKVQRFAYCLKVRTWHPDPIWPLGLSFPL